MDLPKRTKQLISNCILEMQQNSNKFPLPVCRYLIYKSFGLSRLYQPTVYDRLDHFPLDKSGVKKVELIKQDLANLTKADYTLCWLAILTTQKVLPLWKRDFIGDFSPQEVIERVQNVLFSAGDIEELIQLHDILGHGIPGAFSTFESHLVEMAAYDILEFALYPGRASYGEKKGMKQQSSSEQKEYVFYGSDFASSAARAYCVEDSSEPGEWYDYLATKTPKIKFDPNKRLEFWEWWLNEAIPQAWELANNTLKDTE